MIRFLTPLFTLFALPLMAADLVLESSFVWSSEAELFGGFSSLEVSKDGRKFTSTSDRGAIVTGVLLREDGKITGVANAEIQPLLDAKSQPLANYFVDAEGLAIDGKGRMFISFEADHRVWRYDAISAKPVKLDTHPGFKDLQNNSGLEALAIDAAGTLYTLPERSGEWDRPFPVFRYRNGKWDDALEIPRRDKFLPVGADFGPDSWFYLLERDFAWYAGFSSRIRRFQVTDKGFVNEEILLTTGFGTHGNLEGIAVWENDEGGIRLTMIADDNFSGFLSTVIVEYVVVRAE
ncbi:MAG: hypothetical protein ACI861_000179 [Paracoccaceae bacterium]|jgi:hypothetical protein